MTTTNYMEYLKLDLQMLADEKPNLIAQPVPPEAMVDQSPPFAGLPFANNPTGYPEYRYTPQGMQWEYGTGVLHNYYSTGNYFNGYYRNLIWVPSGSSRPALGGLIMQSRPMMAQPNEVWTSKYINYGGTMEFAQPQINTTLKSVFTAYDASGNSLGDFVSSTRTIYYYTGVGGNSPGLTGTTPAGTAYVRFRILQGGADLNVSFQIQAGPTSLATRKVPDGTQIQGWTAELTRYYNFRITDADTYFPNSNSWNGSIFTLYGKHTGPDDRAAVRSPNMPVTAGQWVGIGVTAIGDQSWGNDRLGTRVEWYNSSNTIISTSNAPWGYLGTVQTGFIASQRLQGVLQVPANATSARMMLFQAGPDVATTHFDQVVFITGATAASVSNPDFLATTGAGHINEILNPSGDSGTNAWTPSAGATFTNPPGNLRLVGTPNIFGNNIWVESNLFEVTANGYVAATADLSGAAVAMQYHWFDSLGNHVGYSQFSNPMNENMDLNYDTFGHSPYKVPSGAFQAALRLYIIDPASYPLVSRTLNFRNVMVLSGDSVSDVSGVPFNGVYRYENILGKSSEISISREELQPGIMNVTLNDSELDPLKKANMREGMLLVLRGNANDGQGEKVIYTGMITNIDTEYPAGARPVIKVQAVDGIRNLSNEKRISGGQTMQGLSTTLVGSTIPWSIHATDGAYVKTHDISDASYLDHVVLARDTQQGFAWVDKDNVLQVWGRTDMPSTPKLRFTNLSDVTDTIPVQSYTSGVKVGSGGNRIVNVVTVKRLSIVSGATVETTNGPYSDGASVNDWGAYSKEVTITGAAASTWATSFLAKNATPAPRCDELSFPALDGPSIANAINLELYDAVRMEYTPAGLDSTYRVSSIEHSISPTRWMVNVRFMFPTGTASTSSYSPTGGVSQQ